MITLKMDEIFRCKLATVNEMANAGKKVTSTPVEKIGKVDFGLKDDEKEGNKRSKKKKKTSKSRRQERRKNLNKDKSTDSLYSSSIDSENVGEEIQKTSQLTLIMM